MICGAVLQIVGGILTWTSTRVEMDEIMLHGRVRESEFDIQVKNPDGIITCNKGLDTASTCTEITHVHLKTPNMDKDLSIHIHELNTNRSQISETESNIDLNINILNSEYTNKKLVQIDSKIKNQLGRYEI